MWLPTPIYERTPQLWLLMAVLFVVLGSYIGFAYPLTYFYVALGIVCAIRGVRVLRMRRTYRQAIIEAVENVEESFAEPAGR
ncbi:MAG: hypothetical protein AMS22_02040 [Thiotrichales bacterium SG8_50]|nr:MAG: hypothetical protein AMS22_02040 [Thiotrichales bacterium SG8_50]